MAAEHRRGESGGFWSLFVTQFQGAFSDNVLKNLVILMSLGAVLRPRSMGLPNR